MQTEPPSHTLKEVARTGKALWVIPMEGVTSPDCIEPPTTDPDCWASAYQHALLCEGDCEYGCNGFGIDLPYRVGDEIEIAKSVTGTPHRRWPDKTEFREGEPCGHSCCHAHYSHPCEGCGRTAGKMPSLTVTAVDAKRVAGIEYKDIVAIGYVDKMPFPEGGDVYPEAMYRSQRSEAWLQMRWQELHPDHPFRDAWAWLVALERKDRKA